MAAFDPHAATGRAVGKVDAAQIERVDQVEREAQQARNFARLYADHLAGGGDASDYPAVEGDRGWRQESFLVSPFLGLVSVYDEWNLARERPNPERPFRNAAAWRVAEALLANIGTPITYADLAAVYHQGSMRSTQIQSERIAAIAFGFERPYRPDEDHDKGFGETDLVARKTKLDGKVAYLVRERRDDDQQPDLTDATWRRYYTASGIPEERWTP